MILDTPSDIQNRASAASPETAAAMALEAKKQAAIQSYDGSTKTRIYGSFMIDKSEFAIPASGIKEVVNEPKEVSPVPLSPPFMLGLFNLRGMIIPIIDLRKLLEFPEKEDRPQGKVAVIEYGQQCIGLLFDKTGEVLSEQGAARVKFQSKKNGVKDTVIEGVLKFDDGERLVQILDPVELLQLERVPNGESHLANEAQKVSRGERRNCISFQTGHTSCAIDLRYVKEINEMPEVDQSFLSHGYVIGTTNLRGTILPVIDFRGFMGDEAVFKVGQTIPKGRKMLVLETGEGPIGLMVFSIDSILTYYENEVLPFSKLAIPRSDYVGGCLIDEEKTIVMMLDQNTLLKDPFLVETAKSCQEIHPQEGTEEQARKVEAAEERRTLIQFTIDKKFALDTLHVSEVINRPDEILEPPYSLDFVEGIVNLRGELITLINPRVLYDMPEGKERGSKVLIFKHREQKYGILVDSVDEIVMTSTKNIASLSAQSPEKMGLQVSEDVSECVQHTKPDGTITSILLLDAEALVARCAKSMAEAKL